MKSIITFIILLFAVAGFSQRTWINVTDTLTNTQNDTADVSSNTSYPSKHATIFAKEVAITGSATGTIALQGSIDGSEWYVVQTSIVGAVLGNTQTATTGGIVFNTSPIVGLYDGTNEILVGSALYRFLRVITVQTGTGTSKYKVQIIWK